MSQRVAFVDAFRGCAIVLVVATHAMTYVAFSTQQRDDLRFWVQTIAVPPFFLADGYLMASQKPRCGWYVSYLFKSARRLLLPWALFTIAYGLLRGLGEASGALPPELIMGHEISEVVMAAYRSEIAPQLYFLPSLFLVRLFAYWVPAVRALHPAWILIILLGYAVLWHEILRLWFPDEGLDPLQHAAWGLQYYLLGILLYLGRAKLEERYAFSGMVGSSVCLCALLAMDERSSVVAQYAYLLILWFGMRSFASSVSALSTLGMMTMGIFLFHAPVVLKAISFVVRAIVPGLVWLQYVMIVGLTLAVSVGLTRLCMSVPYGALALGMRATRENNVHPKSTQAR